MIGFMLPIAVTLSTALAPFAIAGSLDMAVRAYLATLFCAMVAIYSAKLLAQRQRDGATTVHLGAPGSAQRLRRRAFQAVQIGLPALLFARLAAPEWTDALALTFTPLVRTELAVLGAALLAAGFTITMYAHAYMGALWRSGTPDAAALERGPDALLQNGPFAVSRNPIFGGVICMQLGLFLAWPSLLTLIICIGGTAALMRQALHEEKTLRERFGPSYAAYCARTPRWL